MCCISSVKCCMYSSDSWASITKTYFPLFQTFHSHFGDSGWNGILGHQFKRNNYRCSHLHYCCCLCTGVPLHLTKFPVESVKNTDFCFRCNNVYCCRWCGSTSFKGIKGKRRRTDINTKNDRYSSAEKFGTSSASWREHTLLGWIIWYFCCCWSAESQRVHLSFTCSLVSSVSAIWLSTPNDLFSL